MSLEKIMADLAASDLPLQSKLDVLRIEFDTNLAPPEISAQIHRSIDELVAGGAADKALKAGETAPDFILPDADRKMVSSRDLLARGPIVVTFYRGVWCPYCNLDLQAMEAARSEVERRGAQMVAISQQTAANSRKALREMGLGFSMLSDKGGEVGAKFGLRWTVPEYLREVHRKVGWTSRRSTAMTAGPCPCQLAS